MKREFAPNVAEKRFGLVRRKRVDNGIEERGENGRIGAGEERFGVGMQLEQNRQRIDTTRLGRELSEQRLDAEQKRFEVGMSTNFNVIQAQRDLAVARNNELQAQLDYQQALITYQTVQLVGGASTPLSATPTVTIPSGTTGSTSTATTSTSGTVITSGGGGPGGQ